MPGAGFLRKFGLRLGDVELSRVTGYRTIPAELPLNGFSPVFPGILNLGRGVPPSNLGDATFWFLKDLVSWSLSGQETGLVANFPVGWSCDGFELSDPCVDFSLPPVSTARRYAVGNLLNKLSAVGRVRLGDKEFAASDWDIFRSNPVEGGPEGLLLYNIYSSGLRTVGRRDAVMAVNVRNFEPLDIPVGPHIDSVRLDRGKETYLRLVCGGKLTSSQHEKLARAGYFYHEDPDDVEASRGYNALYVSNSVGVFMGFPPTARALGWDRLALSPAVVRDVMLRLRNGRCQIAAVT